VGWQPVSGPPGQNPALGRRRAMRASHASPSCVYRCSSVDRQDCAGVRRGRRRPADQSRRTVRGRPRRAPVPRRPRSPSAGFGLRGFRLPRFTFLVGRPPGFRPRLRRRLRQREVVNEAEAGADRAASPRCSQSRRRRRRSASGMWPLADGKSITASPIVPPDSSPLVRRRRRRPAWPPCRRLLAVAVGEEEEEMPSRTTSRCTGVVERRPSSPVPPNAATICSRDAGPRPGWSGRGTFRREPHEPADVGLSTRRRFAPLRRRARSHRLFQPLRLGRP